MRIEQSHADNSGGFEGASGSMMVSLFALRIDVIV
jgi:hypothetical protein